MSTWSTSGEELTFNTEAFERFVTVLRTAIAELVVERVSIGEKDLANKLYDQLAFDSAGVGASAVLPVGVSLPQLDPPRAQALSESLHWLATQTGSVGSLADAIADLSGAFRWYLRSVPEDPVFMSHHANTIILGPNGLVPHAAVQIGLSLVLPDTRYPYHSHPPPELYIILSPARWYRVDLGWFAVGPGDTVYNRPGIEHAMQALDSPLFALWCLDLTEVT